MFRSTKFRVGAAVGAGLLFWIIVLGTFGGDKGRSAASPTPVAQAAVTTSSPTALPTATKPPPPTQSIPTATATHIPPTAVPTKAPTPPPPGRTRDNPVKKGDALAISSKDKGEVEIAVTGVDLNADAKVKGYNRFNTLPKPGEKYILVSVAIKNLTKGQEVMLVHSGSFGFVGSSGRILHEAAVVVPQRPDAELFEGGVVTGDIPFLIPEGDTNLLLIYDAAVLGGQRYYFALE